MPSERDEAGRYLPGSGPNPEYEWTEAIEAEILLRIASGESLRSICADDHLPSRETVRVHIIKDEAFAGQYARSREAQADALFDDVLEIADDARNDWMQRRGDEDAGWVANGENIMRSRLRIDARKWMAGKLRPKVYGDKSEDEGPAKAVINIYGGLPE